MANKEYQLISYNEWKEFNDNFEWNSVMTDPPITSEWLDGRFNDGSVKSVYYTTDRKSFYLKNSEIVFPSYWKYKKYN